MSSQQAAQPATHELLALAAKTREDIDLHDLQDAIAEALSAGKPWPVVMVQTVRMLAQHDGDVRGLRAALMDPIGMNPQYRRTHH